MSASEVDGVLLLAVILLLGIAFGWRARRSAMAIIVLSIIVCICNLTAFILIGIVALLMPPSRSLLPPGFTQLIWALLIATIGAFLNLIGSSGAFFAALTGDTKIWAAPLAISTFFVPVYTTILFAVPQAWRWLNGAQSPASVYTICAAAVVSPLLALVYGVWLLRRSAHPAPPTQSAAA